MWELQYVGVVTSNQIHKIFLLTLSVMSSFSSSESIFDDVKILNFQNMMEMV